MEARKYNLITHNCQIFGAGIIKVLKAVRKHEQDKVRMIEKTNLPGCIINSFWYNEKLSWTNILGRIPVFRFFHDLYLGTTTNFNL